MLHVAQCDLRSRIEMTGAVWPVASGLAPTRGWRGVVMRCGEPDIVRKL
jgi:hypothetical protein